ncbi:3-carboxy-cis,cis-muconate cycloisomerase [Pelagibacterium xiamenense]|uniref:3-carboxy-cis,cis-muconate cycloisomerase n=1 Tax=Pelagibacterium xiamenense TaxID=2901140 RepID=UPI001E4314D7|nr:3-carboxy-cis,cis-muconate cycloisomerase [Pelagibacterium xiamenense]MCD7060670.1 3-carboxy-cis,cis-muconate cycloisomerase [Pelagibacterium xiamenense]
MTASPFDHPLLSGLLGDDEVSVHLGAAADLDAMAAFEAALARAEAAAGLIPAEAGPAIAGACAQFVPNRGDIRIAAARDGVVVVEWVRQLRAAVPEAHREYVHFGATSQDVIDTSLMVRLKAILSLFEDRLGRIVEALGVLDGRFGGNRLMARTRMQDALEISVSGRIADWRLPLQRHIDRLAAVREAVLVLQLGGAVGDRAKFGEKAGEVVALMAAELGLWAPDKAWHSQRDGMFACASWLAGVSGTLGKIGQDIALMALAGDGQIALAGGGGSSAMPHKSNPVAAEVLVGLSRYNSTLVSGMGQAMVHEQERSGAAWTLEWLAFPQMLMTTGAGLLLAERLLGAVEGMGA